MFQRVPQIENTTPYSVVKMDLKKIMALAMIAFLWFPSLTMARADVFTIETDSSFYEPGEDVEILGTADPNANVSLIIIFNETNYMVFSKYISADEDGEYSDIYMLPSNASEGIYNVTAYNETKAETFFNVEPAETPDSRPPEKETAVGLRCAIERAYIFIGKINATVERLGEEGYEVQDIKANLTEAKSHLKEAEELLDLDFDAAELAFSKAREILGSTMGWLHSTAKKVKLTRAEQFVEQFQMRIEKVNGTIKKMQGRLDAGVTAKVNGLLKATMKKLQNIRRKFAVGESADEIDDIIDELEFTVDGFEGSIEELGKEYANQIKSMNKIEAKIRVLRATSGRLNRKGYNTTAVDDGLDEADVLLIDIMASLEIGETVEAEGLIEGAENLISEVGDLIRGIRKEYQNKGDKGKVSG